MRRLTTAMGCLVLFTALVVGMCGPLLDEFEGGQRWANSYFLLSLVIVAVGVPVLLVLRSRERRGWWECHHCGEQFRPEVEVCPTCGTTRASPEYSGDATHRGSADSDDNGADSASATPEEDPHTDARVHWKAMEHEVRLARREARLAKEQLKEQRKLTYREARLAAERRAKQRALAQRGVALARIEMEVSDPPHGDESLPPGRRWGVAREDIVHHLDRLGFVDVKRWEWPPPSPELEPNLYEHPSE